MKSVTVSSDPVPEVVCLDRTKIFSSGGWFDNGGTGTAERHPG